MNSCELGGFGVRKDRVFSDLVGGVGGERSCVTRAKGIIPRYFGSEPGLDFLGLEAKKREKEVMELVGSVTMSVPKRSLGGETNMQRYFY